MEHLHLFLTLVLGATACPTLQKSCSKCSVTDVYNTYSDKLMVDYDIPMDDILLVSATDAVSEHIGEDGCLQAIFHCPPRTYGAFWQTGLYSERSTAPQFNTHLRNVTCSEDSKWMVLEKYLGFLELSNVFCYHTEACQKCHPVSTTDAKCEEGYECTTPEITYRGTVPSRADESYCGTFTTNCTGDVYLIFAWKNDAVMVTIGVESEPIFCDSEGWGWKHGQLTGVTGVRCATRKT